MAETSSTPAIRPVGDDENVLQEISILLRDGRLDSGESIDDVARALRINRRYLEAIEESRFDELPGPVYTLGFIRSFGDHVGLDGEELVRRYKFVSSADSKRAELDFPEPIPESGVPGGAVMFAGLVVAALAYGGWYVLSEDDSFLSDLVAPVPEQLAENAAETDETLQSVIEPEALNIVETAVEPSSEPVEVADGTEAVDAGEGSVAGTTAETVAAVGGGGSESDGEAAGQAEDAVETVVETVETADETVEQAVEDVETVAEAAASATIESEPETGGEGASVDAAAEHAAAHAEQGASLDAANLDATIPDTASPSAAETITEESASDAAASGAAGEVASAQALNEEQLRAIQAEMIDVPAPEFSTPALDQPDSAATEIAGEIAAEAVVEAEQTADDTPSEQVASIESDAPVVEDVIAEPVAAAVEDEPRSGRSRIIIVAKSSSWVEIRVSETREIIYSRLMREGQRFNVPNREGLEMETGNAGALDIIIDGTVIPSIGRGGQVERNFTLDPDELRRHAGVSAP